MSSSANQASAPVVAVAYAYPVTPDKEGCGSPVDLHCYEKMPSPKEKMYTSFQHVSKKTYCGSELVYDMGDSIKNLFPCQECETLPVNEKCPRCSEEQRSVSKQVSSDAEKKEVSLDAKPVESEITPDTVKAGGLGGAPVVQTLELREGAVERTGSDAKSPIERTGSDAKSPVERTGSDAKSLVERTGSDAKFLVERTGSVAVSPDLNETFVFNGPKRLRGFSSEPPCDAVRPCVNRVGLDADEEDIPKLEREG